MALSIAELAPQDEKLQLLLEAIDSASRGTLQVVLKAIYQDDQSIRDRVSNSLLITEDQVRIPSKDDEESDEEGSEDEKDEDDEDDEQSESEDENPRSERRRSNQQATGSKRLRHRYAYCENCDKGFDVTKNTKPAEDIIQTTSPTADTCYPDEEFFVDDNQYMNGDYDNGEVLETYPEGYIYECCDRRGDEEPCTVDRHKEYVSIKRQKIEGSLLLAKLGQMYSN
ncbi:hypothetical protein BDV35DRAFT_388813 [Aspergillus flavus]|uniref:Uncharacterized protein n=1 Tax=Aspergillus flavus TaxID=5059 RepID=A0A5N6H850_ASPFL|nr:hypothetical protein BDV35DRAFT_388813 [Aspergillus flavus]